MFSYYIYKYNMKEENNLKKRFCIILVFFILLSIIYSVPIHAFGPSSSNIYNGIDVSYWQGNIDFSSVRNDGIEVVYIRAGQGSTYKDSYFERNYSGAKANGLKVGFYHYVTARSIDQAVQQAQFFASIISGKEPDCRLAVDFESFGSLQVSEINAITLQFAQTLEEVTGKEVVIYSNAYSALTVFNEEVAAKYPIWVADYGVSEPFDNGKWTSWVGFQYTSRGNVSGISGYVDLDYYTDGIFLSDLAPVPPDDSNDEDNNNGAEYIVQEGDTLAKIALENNTSVNHLVSLNNISNANLIYVGQKLIVNSDKDEEEAGDTNHIYYTIKVGDTLDEISEKYDASIETLVELNQISNPNLIYAGYAIRVPVYMQR